jgi:3-deoxy-D-arabino-heptulosonate 7-phosphate (DAHP) synthase
LEKPKNQLYLKRGFSALIKEWLLAAEYLVQQVTKKIILL